MHSAPTVGLYLPSLDGGGAERVFVQLANRFAVLGLRVQLVLALGRGPYLNEVSGAVKIIDLRASGVLNSLPGLVRYLRSERPQVLLSALDHANLVALLACRVAGTATRSVISMRSVPSAVYREERGARRWVMPLLLRGCYRYADAIIANSQAVASDLIENFGVPAEKLSIIYNPIDLPLIERLSYEEVKDPWLAANSSPLVLGVGSLAVLKDFPTLIRAFSILRSRRACRLAILGEGPDRSDLESLATELNILEDIHLPGFVANPFAWMRVARVFVSSSLTEGCPNALMQALACGTSVVSTNCLGGSAEILEGGRWGRLVPIQDPLALADSIQETLELKEPVKVKVRAADFGMEAIALSYLRSLLPDRASPPVLEH